MGGFQTLSSRQKGLALAMRSPSLAPSVAASTFPNRGKGRRMYRRETTPSASTEAPALPETEEGLALRLVDVVLTLSGTLAAAYLVFAGRWVPGWLPSAIAYAVIAAGPPVLRWIT